jgi:hypothetical protein
VLASFVREKMRRRIRGGPLNRLRAGRRLTTEHIGCGYGGGRLVAIKGCGAQLCQACTDQVFLIPEVPLDYPKPKVILGLLTHGLVRIGVSQEGG